MFKLVWYAYLYVHINNASKMSTISVHKLDTEQNKRFGTTYYQAHVVTFAYTNTKNCSTYICFPTKETANVKKH